MNSWHLRNIENEKIQNATNEKIQNTTVNFTGVSQNVSKNCTGETIKKFTLNDTQLVNLHLLLVKTAKDSVLTDKDLIGIDDKTIEAYFYETNCILKEP